MLLTANIACIHLQATISFCQAQVNKLKMFILLVFAIAFTCIVPINGNPTLEQKVNALERRLDETNKRLSIVEHERTSLCSKYNSNVYHFLFILWNMKILKFPLLIFQFCSVGWKRKSNRWANPSWLDTNNEMTNTSFDQKWLRPRCHDFSVLAHWSPR